MNTTEVSGWREISQVVALLVQVRPSPLERTLLVGLKKTGVIAGCVVPIGGHVKPTDNGNLMAATAREVREESGLTIVEPATHGHKVAELIVRIRAQRLTLRIHVFRFYEADSRGVPPKVDPKEFEWLKFIPLSELPWDQFPPRDRDWLEPVLTDNVERFVTITCGRDRFDVLDIKQSELFPV